MRAENRDTTLQRFRKYSSSIEVGTAGFREEKRRRTGAFSAVSIMRVPCANPAHCRDCGKYPQLKLGDVSFPPAAARRFSSRAMFHSSRAAPLAPRVAPRERSEDRTIVTDNARRLNLTIPQLKLGVPPTEVGGIPGSSRTVSAVGGIWRRLHEPLCFGVVQARVPLFTKPVLVRDSGSHL